MRVNDIIDGYSTGDACPWVDEFAYMLDCHGEQMAMLVNDIDRIGIENPIILGDDGRVWDGHHRLMAARILGIEEVEVQNGYSLES